MSTTMLEAACSAIRPPPARPKYDSRAAMDVSCLPDRSASRLGGPTPTLRIRRRGLAGSNETRVRPCDAPPLPPPAPPPPLPPPALPPPPPLPPAPLPRPPPRRPPPRSPEVPRHPLDRLAGRCERSPGLEPLGANLGNHPRSSRPVREPRGQARNLRGQLPPARAARALMSRRSCSSEGAARPAPRERAGPKGRVACRSGRRVECAGGGGGVLAYELGQRGSERAGSAAAYLASEHGSSQRGLACCSCE